MTTADLKAFCQTLVRSKLLAEAEVADLLKLARATSPAAAFPEGFAAWLVQQGKLTPYQSEALQRGHTQFLLDDYKLQDRIGVGRMAGVYRAVHKLGMPVAIKILPPKRAKKPVDLARFQREAQLALQLDHPHVIKTYHAGSSGGLHYIAMELLEGQTLDERLQERGKLPPAEVLRLAEQALAALQHLHDKGMVHRDVKPGNFMLVPAPGGKDETAYGVKLLDVGLGRALFSEEEEGPSQELTATGDLIGTPDYTAPEQTRNSHAADVRSDMYSLGCVLYECLTGRVPFPDKNVVQKILKHSTQMPTDLNLGGGPQAQALQTWLWKLMAKKPEQRFQTPAEALHALAMLRQTPARSVPVAPPVPLATPVAATAVPTPPEEEDGSASPPLPWIYLAAAAAVLLVLLILAWIAFARLTQHNREAEPKSRMAAPEPRAAFDRGSLPPERDAGSRDPAHWPKSY